MLHPDFPHQTTLDQFFDEEQFEAYRQLGVHVAEGLFSLSVLGGQRPVTIAAWFADSPKISCYLRSGSSEAAGACRDCEKEPSAYSYRRGNKAWLGSARESSRRNFEAARQGTLGVARSVSERLAGTVVSDAMKMCEKMITMDLPARSPPFRRLPADSGRTYWDVITSAVAFFGGKATVADAKAKMEATPQCQDVIVTENGQSNEPVLGWISKIDIGGLSQAR